RSIAFAMLLTMTMTAAVVAEAEQDGTTIQPSRATAETETLRAGPRGRPFLAALCAIPLVTDAAAQGPRDSQVLTPADRFATAQLIGVVTVSVGVAAGVAKVF